MCHKMGFPGGSDRSACNAGDLGSIPELGRCPGERNSYPLQYSCLKNSLDRGLQSMRLQKSFAFFFRFFSIIGYCKVWSIVPVVYTRTLLFILYRVVCLCQFQTPSLSLFHFHLWQLSVDVLCL